MAGSLIVAAEFGAADFAWLNGLRQAHFPLDRNQLPAHLTMFHAIPPFAEAELRTRLAEAARAPRPKASAEGLMNLGRGVAVRIVAPALVSIRDELAGALHGLLTAQDSAGWRPHVTIQNKVAPKVASALKEQLEASFQPRPLVISGIALHRYEGGPWALLQRYSFRA